MSQINWAKMLAGELSNQLKERNKLLEDVKRKKLFELETNIMMRKKMMSKELTQLELDHIEKEESELVHSKAS